MEELKKTFKSLRKDSALVVRLISCICDGSAKGSFLSQPPSMAHSWLLDLCSCTNTDLYYISSGLRVETSPLSWLGQRREGDGCVSSSDPHHLSAPNPPSHASVLSPLCPEYCRQVPHVLFCIFCGLVAT